MKVYYSDFSELRVYPFQFPIHIAQKTIMMKPVIAAIKILILHFRLPMLIHYYSSPSIQYHPPKHMIQGLNKT